ncbi:hypothetical protein Tco_0435609 [Tanacetum coccineum]
MCGVCIGILACRGLSLVSSPLHAMKSQSQIQSSAVVKFGGVTDWYQATCYRELRLISTLAIRALKDNQNTYALSITIYFLRRNQEMSQSLSSNMPDNSLEQESAMGHSILRRLDSPTSQATQLPELELTLTPATGRELSQEIN